MCNVSCAWLGGLSGFLIDTMFYHMLTHYVEECCSDLLVFFFQAEDGIRDLVRSRGLGDVYKRQEYSIVACEREGDPDDTLCRIEKVKNPKRSGVLMLSLIHI